MYCDLRWYLLGTSPDIPFLKVLRDVFDGAAAQVFFFYNPLLERDSASTLYVART